MTPGVKIWCRNRQKSVWGKQLPSCVNATHSHYLEYLFLKYQSAMLVDYLKWNVALMDTFTIQGETEPQKKRAQIKIY